MSDEFSRSLNLSRHGHDRDSGRRATEGHLTQLWRDENTRVIVVRDGKSLGRASADEMALLYFTTTDLVDVLAADGESATTVYLGKARENDTKFVAVILDSDASTHGIETATNAEWFDLRAWGHAMSDLDTGLLTQALALANWHVSHAFSPLTGEPTRATSSGWVRSTESNRQMFPRTDVAIIVLVTDNLDRVLLGNNALWESNRFSLLAGYVDPGESLEAAVVREVFEESGMHVDSVVYKGSQPWPFPASLMVGFTARVSAGHDPQQLRPDGEEIVSLRWFSKDDLRGSLDEIVLPGRTSIARALLEDWLGEPLDQNEVWLGAKK